MKIFGIPVKIDPSFLFVCALLAYSRLSHPAFLVEWLIVISSPYSFTNSDTL